MTDPYLCRQIWARVLLQVIRDLAIIGRYDFDACGNAERWVGEYPSRDFREVCALAGLNPEAVFPWFRKLCQTSLAERRAMVDVIWNSSLFLAESKTGRHAA